MSEARVEGVSREKAGWLTRIGYWFARRRVGQVPEPMKVMAHNPWVMRAYGGFELGIERARKVDPRLKALANVKAASIIGCVW